MSGEQDRPCTVSLQTHTGTSACLSVSWACSHGHVPCGGFDQVLPDPCWVGILCSSSSSLPVGRGWELGQLAAVSACPVSSIFVCCDCFSDDLILERDGYLFSKMVIYYNMVI